MGFYHSDSVSVSLFESTAWDFESRQSMKAKHQLTMPFAVSDILISHMLVCLFHIKNAGGGNGWINLSLQEW